MFVKGTLKKAGILLTLALMPLLFGYFLISFLLFSFIAFMMQFFRDPERSVEVSEGMILASADGRILNGKIDKIKIVNYDDHLMKYILEKGKRGILISTFMSPFDVHVNRVPVSGKVIKTKYCPGKFQIAWKDVQKENEKNLIVIDSKYGKVGVIQIAGFVARRIVQYVKVGDHVKIGDRLGMIRFGSRVDIILPYENCEVLVKIGEKSKAGETIIAQMIENNI
ncbi:MAG: archaetidylserine decarboxylase [Methanobacteriaceae archaeon]|nr:archaetidylserine decarboxylase [Methanobacteriaceae archaeon]